MPAVVWRSAAAWVNTATEALKTRKGGSNSVVGQATNNGSTSRDVVGQAISNDEGAT